MQLKYEIRIDGDSVLEPLSNEKQVESLAKRLKALNPDKSVQIAVIEIQEKTVEIREIEHQ